MIVDATVVDEITVAVTVVVDANVVVIVGAMLDSISKTASPSILSKVLVPEFALSKVTLPLFP